MFIGCFVIGETFVLTTMEKLDLGNACTDKLINLDFIHKEYFHWYNRLLFYLF